MSKKMEIHKIEDSGNISPYSVRTYDIDSYYLEISDRVLLIRAQFTDEIHACFPADRYVMEVQ